jgi:hypothetical protein
MRRPKTALFQLTGEAYFQLDFRLKLANQWSQSGYSVSTIPTISSQQNAPIMEILDIVVLNNSQNEHRQEFI